jgi:hypothetical protein
VGEGFAAGCPWTAMFTGLRLSSMDRGDELRRRLRSGVSPLLDRSKFTLALAKLA